MCSHWEGDWHRSQARQKSFHNPEIDSSIRFGWRCGLHQTRLPSEEHTLHSPYVRHRDLFPIPGKNWFPVAGNCCQNRGNINGSADGLIDVSDIVFLVSYMFNYGTPPPCLEEAEINGYSPAADIADLIALVRYMFNNGSAPSACP